MSLPITFKIIKFEMDKSKIALLTTVANFDLYKKSSVLFPSDCQKYVIDGTNGMHGIHSIFYMMKKLKGRGIEWLVMADEDVIFSDSNLVYEIIDEMKARQITVCGVRDGGVTMHRNQNPYVINTFFSIINFKEIENNWNKKEVFKNQFIIENEFDDDCSKLPYKFDVKSTYEPYYCFYFWLRRQGKKFLFLDSKMNSDGISNYVYFNEKEILCHTWYARSYGNNAKHTKRIDAILSATNGVILDSQDISNSFIYYKKTTFATEQLLLKYWKKIKRKLSK
jgi:hypothetical protein